MLHRDDGAQFRGLVNKQRIQRDRRSRLYNAEGGKFPAYSSTVTRDGEFSCLVKQ